MGARKGYTLGKFRRDLHRAEVFTGDVQAVRRGRILQRIGNRIIGALLADAARRTWR